MSLPDRQLSKTRWTLLAIVLVIIAAAAGVLIWRGQDRRSASRSDLIAALTANNRGVVFMGHSKEGFPEAEKAFREAMQAAPDWLPARINLGIALLNQDTPEKLAAASAEFEGILQIDPANPYAHYCLGIIAEHQNQTDTAFMRFKKVTEIDSNDAYAFLHLGLALFNAAQSKRDEAPAEYEQGLKDALREFERARRLDPYLAAATYQISQIIRVQDPAQAKDLLEEKVALEQGFWENIAKIRYGDMGKYATVIGMLPEISRRKPRGPVPTYAHNPQVKIELRIGTGWARTANLSSHVSGKLIKAIRARFGATIVVLDFNLDGREDLLLLGAVVDCGVVFDLLLRNDGDNHFTDVTREAGLNQASTSFACVAADFDNDGYPDLVFTGHGGIRLLRNNRKNGFTDVTREAGLDKLKSICLGAMMVDVDQDGDLDLVVAQIGETAEQALANLSGPADKRPAGGNLLLFLNVGEAKPASPRDDPPPLTPRFARYDDFAKATAPANVINCAMVDADGDLDLDLLAFATDTAPSLILNNRLLRFAKARPLPPVNAQIPWSGAIALDADHDGRSDLFLVSPVNPPQLLLSRPRIQPDGSREVHFESGTTEGASLLQALAIDLDLDGWTDVIGLQSDRRLLFLQGYDAGFAATPLPGIEAAWPKDALALGSLIRDPHGPADVFCWSEENGLQFYQAAAHPNRGLTVRLTGHRRVDVAGEPTRSNTDGIGARVSARAAEHHTGAENTTRSSGLGQSRSLIQLGLGRHSQPDSIEIDWPDTVWQAEFGQANDGIVYLHEKNRKSTSCPVLFAWNGSRYEFVTDFLGAGALAEQQADGTCRPPRPEESVKIEAEQLAALEGHYVLKVTEPMNEVIYLDRLRLMAIDHPENVDIFPDERFSGTTPPSQNLFALRPRIFPIKATDSHGRDVTSLLRERDRRMLDGFRRRSWRGFAESHWVELDFGKQLSSFRPGVRIALCLAGWTDYPYPESIWAASQAGIALAPPRLERRTSDGRWQTIIEDLGFPAGLPRVIIREISNLVAGPECRLRISTNMIVCWDQIFAAPIVDFVPEHRLKDDKVSSPLMNVWPLEISEAILSSRGLNQEFSPDGRQPTIYSHDRTETVALRPLSGRLTRLGPVTELLQEHDDCFAVFGPGDEVTVRFDARQLPTVLAGWKRSFVLRSWGYSKDTGVFTAANETVEPMPFKEMSKYPYGKEEHYPQDAKHTGYQRRFNTRLLGQTGR